MYGSVWGSILLSSTLGSAKEKNKQLGDNVC